MTNTPSGYPVSLGEQQQYSVPFLPGDEEEGSEGLTIAQAWNMLRAYLWVSIAAFFALAALAFGVIKLLPKSFEAIATLIVNIDNTDPLAGRNNSITQSYSFFPTQLELINNNVTLRPVIDQLKLKEDIEFTGGFVGDEHTLNDIVLASLRSSLRVFQGTGSQLLYISFTNRDPNRAAAVANAVADEYMRQTSQRINAPAVERAGRYSEQLAELKDKVDAAQVKVAEYRQLHGMGDLADGHSGDFEGTGLIDLQNKLLEAQNARRQLEGRQLTPEATSLRSRIDSLESDMAKLRTTLGPRHPDTLRLQSEIDATRRALDVNSVSHLERARELETKYESALAAERNRLLERRELQDEGSRLALELQLARDVYAQALRGLDQVQFASVGNYMDVTVVSRAEPPIKASRPNKKKLFVAALAAGFALAFGGPIAFELLLNRRIRCRDDLERNFGIEMLAQLGPIKPVPAG